MIEEGSVLAKRWHKTIIEPGVDVDGQIAAVNADITMRPELRAAPIDPRHLPMLKDPIARAMHTPELVRSYRDRLKAQQA